MRTVVIGAGLIGTKRIANLPSTFELVGVHDVNKLAIARLQDAMDVQTQYLPDLNQIWQLQPETVIVATNHVSLAPIALEALEHGCHILIEKPGANTLGPLLAVRDEARKMNRVAHVGYNHRFHPAFIKTRELLRDKQYGKLLWIRGRYGHGGRVGYEKEWRANAALSGGGELLDQGSHLIDLTRMCVGDVTLDYAKLQTSYWKMGVEDNAFLALSPTVGGLAWLHASWTEWKNTFSFEIVTERLKIDINGLGGSYGTESMTVYEMQPEMGPPPFYELQWPHSDISWKLELEDFQRAINGEAAIGATIDDAIAVHQIVKEAYKQ